MSAVQEKRGDDNTQAGKHVDSPSPDSDKELQHSVRRGLEYYFPTCRCETDHTEECPYRTHGMACHICRQPCEIEEHQDNFKAMLKLCYHCYVLGRHWSVDCPNPIWNKGDDVFF